MKSYFFSNLKKLRKDYNISQTELGNLINYSSKNISKWESNKAIPNINILNKISKCFNNISISDLIYVDLSDNDFDFNKDFLFAKNNLKKFTKDCIYFLYDIFLLNIKSSKITVRLNENRTSNFYFLNESNQLSVNRIESILQIYKLNNLIENYTIEYNENHDFVCTFNLTFSYLGFNMIRFDLQEFIKNVKKYYFDDYLCVSEYEYIKNNSSFSKQTKLILSIIENLNKDIFCLNDLYEYEHEISNEYPNSKSIKNTIRKSVSILIDKGLIIKTTEKGIYKVRFYAKSSKLLANKKYIFDFSKLLQKDLLINCKMNDQNNLKKIIITENFGNDFKNINILFKDFNFNNNIELINFIKILNNCLSYLIDIGILRYADLTISDIFKNDIKNDILCNFHHNNKKHIFINYAIR